MKLTPAQQDALDEITNIGASKAAKQLSKILRDKIYMQALKVEIESFDKIMSLIGLGDEDKVVAVHQSSQGLLNAEIALLFPSQESRELVQALVSSQVPLDGVDLRAFEHEAITEIGNIVISSTISAIADLLGGHLKMTLPVYMEGTFSNISKNFNRGIPQEDQFVLVMEAVLQAAERNVSGKLMITFSFIELQKLLKHIDGWLENIKSE